MLRKYATWDPYVGIRDRRFEQFTNKYNTGRLIIVCVGFVKHITIDVIIFLNNKLYSV